MRLQIPPRVQYDQNPLLEVIAQIRFPRILEIDTQLPSLFQRAVKDRFPFLHIEEAFAFSIASSQLDMPIEQAHKQPSKLYHFISVDQNFRITLSSEFVSVTCEKYKNWAEFRECLIWAFGVATDVYDIGLISRVGLRYRDVVFREKLGLEGVEWTELIQPYALGLAGSSSFCEEGRVPSTDIQNLYFNYQLKLDNCDLQLQTGFAASKQSGSGAELGFMIDSDFSNQKLIRVGEDVFGSEFDNLHKYSSAVFRSCISERLHQALIPKPAS